MCTQLPKNIKRNPWLRLPRLALQLVLTGLLLSVAIGAKAEDYKKPTVISSDLSPNISGNSHITFKFLWFNMCGGNYGYTNRNNDVYLQVDGVNVVNLTDSMLTANSAVRNYMCRLFNAWEPSSSVHKTWNGGVDEANTMVKQNQNNIILQTTFTNNAYVKGRLILSKPEKDGNNYWVTAELILQEWNVDKKHTIAIKGDWVSDGKKDSPDVGNTLTISMDYPSAPQLPQTPGTYKRSASRQITHTLTGLMQLSHTTATTTESKSFKWIYSLGDWTTRPNDDKVGNQFWGWNAVSSSAANSARKMWIDSQEGENTMEGTFTVPSNWEDFTVYPKVRMWMGNYYGVTCNTFWDKQTQGYNKNYPAQVIPGFPRPKDIKFEVDQWSKQVKILWSVDMYSSKCNDNGTWYVFRSTSSNGSSLVNLGPVSYGTEFTDNSSDLKYDVTYYYWVAFVPSEWNLSSGKITSYTQFPDLYARANTKITRSFTMTATATPLVDGVKVICDSKYSITDAGKTYRLVLFHAKNSTTFPSDSLTSFTINANDPIHFEYDHKTDMGTSCDVHNYYFQLSAMDKTWTSNKVSSSISGQSYVTGITASRGDNASTVKIMWTANQVSTTPCSFLLYRRPLGSTLDSDWRQIYAISGTASDYSYDDSSCLPGTYYEYKVESIVMCSNNKVTTGVEKIDGFSLATGIVSGRITYSSGNAVSGVKVSLRSDKSDARDQFCALKMDGAQSGVTADVSTNEFQNMLNDGYSVQFWMKPDNNLQDNMEYILYDLNTTSTLYLKKVSGGALLNLTTRKNFSGDKYQTQTLLSDKIPLNEYSHVTITYKPSVMNGTTVAEAGKVTAYVKTTSREYENTVDADWLVPEGNAIAMGNYTGLTYTQANRYPFVGYMDEFRVWSRTLTKSEIDNNYDRTLSGSENGLSLYWPMDEGIKDQPMVYDVSKSYGANNGHHGKVGKNTASSDIVPSSDQLSLYAITDNIGNYVLRGIPFSGTGVTYQVTPILGTHKFDPGSNSVFISSNSLVKDNLNFMDISSFEVKGRVLYTNTTYPVAGVGLYVDGEPCMRDGEKIVTDADGNFSISLPNGNHYISVAMEGHTFTNADGKSYKQNGYYPTQTGEGSVMQTVEFTQDLTNLTFYDNTLVPVAGRVVGGYIENDKPLGFGASVNNIGVATIRMSAGNVMLNAVQKTDEASFYYEANSEPLQLSVPENAKCSSTAFIGAGVDECGTITITTDSETGEFAVMLPPLKYTVDKIDVGDGTQISWSAMSLDASNPLNVNTDSLETNGNLEFFEYVASLKKAYRSPATLQVTQKGARKAGAFGDYEVNVVDDNMTTHNVVLYDKDATFALPLESQPAYQFGYPLFTQGKKYSFDITMFEEYTNCDNNKHFVVPLEGLELSIANRMSALTALNVDANNATVNGTVNEEYSKSAYVTLDSLGHATYEWLVGYPNLQDDHTFTMDITYLKEGSYHSWKGNGFKGIVLGNLSSGNGFTTNAPDQVNMILRDPAGTGSYAWIEEGQTNTRVRRTARSNITNDNLEFTTKVGVHNSIVAGTDAAGVIVCQITDINTKIDVGVGYNIQNEYRGDDTTTETTTVTTRYQTSSDADYVGANGDLFIGSAMNQTFGNAREVGVYWDLQTGKPKIDTDDVFTYGTSYGTDFAYTQDYIEKDLINKFIKQRNDLLEVVDSYDNVSPHPTEVRYVTTLSREDSRFGSNNSDKSVWGKDASAKGSIEGPSYRMILPENAYLNRSTLQLAKGYGTQDMVCFYNAQVSGWKQILANNEAAKVAAIQARNKYLDQNHSFDAGSSFAYTVTNDHTFDYTDTRTTVGLFVTDQAKGFEAKGCGFELEHHFEEGGLNEESGSKIDNNTTTFGYVLAENGSSDALTIDVLKAPDGFGPIFYTRGGQTSCPYEDAVQTKYYNPGFVIQAKTMQVEQPKLDAKVTTVSGVPSGKAANFEIMIHNTSEIDEDCWFNLNVIDTSNPNGADVLMDGYNITNGRTILVPAGKTLTKTLQVKQTQEDIYDYENLLLRISSVCEPDGIEDVLPLTAHFQKTSSDIGLDLNLTSVNTVTGTNLKFTISGYNKSAAGLQKAELQYQKVGDPSWVTSKEWTVAELDDAGTFEYILDMSNNLAYPDGDYNFRGLCTSIFGSETVTTSSEIINIYKDTKRPQLITAITPTDGILNAGDEISLTFNENIRDGEIRELDNFILNGVLNDADVAHDVAANFTNGEPAKTQSRIDLSAKSFGVDMWVKYAGAGHLMTHGSGSETFDVSVNASDQLVVKIGSETYTSVEKLQKNKWMFLSMAYDSEASVFSSHYAYDAYTVTLFNNKAVNAYNGYGSLVLGEGLTGQMHDVALWDNARSWADAQGEMYKMKNRYSHGLIGYWRMDEGHGSQAADMARSRTMTMPSSTAWYLEKKNYALTLENDLIVGAFIADKVTNEDESYMAELWFRAEPAASPAGSPATVPGSVPSAIAAGLTPATIMALDNNKLDIFLNARGGMEMKANGQNYTVSNTDYRDGNWHHLALNVLKNTNGNATVYVDGDAKKSVSATAVPALQSAYMLFGGNKTTVNGGTVYGQPLKGNLDEIRLWKGHFDASVIRNNMYNRVDEKDEALLAYYPFEYTHLDEGNQSTQSSTLGNRITGAEGLGAALSILSGGQDPTAGTAGQSVANTTSVGVVGLKSAPVRQNVNFTFTASERQLLIKLTDDPARLENCTVHLTVRNIRDAHNNACDNISWDVLVRQNQLLWSQNAVDVRKQGDEKVTFTADIMNSGGTTENWWLGGMPEWLTASSESGSLAPQASKTITFTVDPAIACGRYDERVYLTGSLNIAEPLNVSLASLVEAPDWSVDGEMFENSMNVIARLKIDGSYSEDSEDIVAAFNGETCVGVAKPAYIERFDGYYLMMTVYGNDDEVPVRFKVFDASKGVVYPSSLTSQAVRFQQDAIYGSLAAPVIIETTNEIEQTLNINKGWTWISLFLNPTDASPAAVFGGESGGVVEYLKSKDSYSQKIGDNWGGNILQMASGNMYKVKATDAATITIIGQSVDPASEAMRQTVSKGWNWIGYTNTGTCSLNAAFADLDPQDDDVVKNQNSFAIYSSGEWIGSLTSMVPGCGYAYHSNASGSKTFNFPVVNAMSGVSHAKGKISRKAVSASGYMGNMNLIAVVRDGDDIIHDAHVAVYDAEGEVRGISSNAVVDDVHFLTIGGNDNGDVLRLVVTVGNTEYIVAKTVGYSEDSIMGSLAQPYVIQIGDTSGIESRAADVDATDAIYDISGKKVTQKHRHGIYIENNTKVVK